MQDLTTQLTRVIATAGHVDHGKSSLVRALTGVDPDRLPEEKARGMTTDLGFALLDHPACAARDRRK
jgi:selenocysteine-specific elongation factor